MDLNGLQETYDNVFDGAPVKMAVEHFCYDGSKMDGHIATSSVLLDENFCHQLRSQFGMKADFMFKLQTYGIPTEEFPINDNDDEMLNLGW
jgi:hypothetical protein